MTENQGLPTAKKERMSHRAIKSVLWSSSGTAVQFVANIAVMMILARLLTPSEFGIAGAAATVIAFFQVFSQIGLGQALIQRQELNQDHIRSAFTTSVIIGFLLTILIYMAAAPLAAFFRMETNGLQQVMQLASLIFIIRGFGVVAEALLQRETNFRFLGMAQAISFAFCYTPVAIFMAWKGYGVWSLIGAQLAQGAVEVGLVFFKAGHSKLFGLNRKAFSELMSIGRGLTVSKVANYAALQGDNILVGRYLGSDSLGLYGRAYRLMALPANLLGDVVEMVAFSTFSKIQTQREKLAEAYRKATALMALVAIPASVYVVILSPEIISVLLGPQWTGVVKPLQILAVGMYFRMGWKIAATVTKSFGLVNPLARRQVLYALSVVCGVWLAIPYGLSGVAAVVVLALTLQFLMITALSFQVTQTVNWSNVLAIHLPPIRLGVIVFVVTSLTAYLLRAYGMPPLVIIAASLGTTATAVLIAVRILPRACLGNEGLWWSELIQSKWSFTRGFARVLGLSS